MAFTRTVMRDQIRELIMARIISGEYQPGSRIVESQVANELGVSQAPVREALRELEAMRFVETEPYKGARVRTVALGELEDIYPVRAGLEEVAANLAVAKADPTSLQVLIAGLRADLHDMRSAAVAGDIHEQMVADARFHRRVVDAAHNDTLLQLWSSLRIEASTLVSAIGADSDLAAIAETHLPLLVAIESGDPDEAGSAFKCHIREFGQNVTVMLAHGRAKD